MENEINIVEFAKNNTKIKKNSEWNYMFNTYKADTECYKDNTKKYMNILTYGITGANAIKSPEQCLICEYMPECAKGISDAMKDYILKTIKN